MGTEDRLLGGRYELGALLASGGMGRVWRGRDIVLNRPVAVKVLRSEYTEDESFLARFRAEAQHAAALHHPNVAAVFDYGEAEQDGERLAYLVMELVDGESLAAVLARRGRLDVAESLQIMRGTAAALAVAHSAGLVHRDVKPGNVLVTPGGDVKITDFGIAWSAASVPLTRTGQVIGTAHYFSPEQAQGGRATPASDVYSLGAVTYECLTGRRVFDGENSVQIAVKHIREEPDPLPSDLPGDVRGLVERAMAKEPARRFPDGDALVRAIDDVLAGRGLPAVAGPAAAAVAPTVVASAAAATAAAVGDGGGPTGTAVFPRPVVPPASSSAGGAPAARRRPVALLLGALAAAVLVAGVLVGTALLGDSGTTTPPAATSSAAPATTAEQATAEPTPETVTLDPATYVGRPFDEVQAELADLGLVVVLQPVPTADQAEGLVLGVTPTDGLAPGSTVTVTHAVAPPPPPPVEPDEDQGVPEESDDEKKKDEKDNGRGRGNDGD